MDSACSGVTFDGICKDSLYFQVTDDEGLESDLLKKTRAPARSSWIKDKDGKFVYIGHEDRLKCESLCKDQLQTSDCQFNIQTYTQSPHSGKGQAVVLFVKKQDQVEYKVVCCDDMKVHVETVASLPKEIEGVSSKFVFFLNKVVGHKDRYYMRPSLYPPYLLGLDAAGDSLFKLVLHGTSQNDQPDEGSLVYVEKL